MKFRNRFTTVIILILTLMFGAFTGILTLASFFYFNHYPIDFYEGFVDTYPDSPLVNILIVLACILFVTLFSFLLKKIKIKDFVFPIAAGVISLAVLGFLILFVYKTRCVPVCDQMQLVLDAIFFKNGNYEDMKGYLNTFQQQYGLVFLEEIIMRIKEDYRVFQYMNAFFTAGSMFAVYPIAKLLSGNARAAFLAFLTAVLFVPLFFYTNFVYGEVPSLFFAMYGVWMLLLFLKNGKDARFINKRNWFYLIPTILLFTLSYISRTNLVILLIALCLSLFLYGIREKKALAFLVAAILIIIPLLANSAIKRSYELRSGYEIGTPQPALGWIAMGMQYSETRGYGFCNDYANNTFTTLAGSDRDIANQLYKEEISNRIQDFKNVPGSAGTFYRMKMLQQWNEGTFGSIVSTNAFIDGIPGKTTGKIFSNVYGKYINMFCNRYLAVVYFGFFVYAVTGIIMLILNLIGKSEKEYDENDSGVPFEYLLIAYFIGGFLFSLLWEAKPRYVFPYVFMCIPFAAVGYGRLSRIILTGFGKLKKEKKTN